jgi:hypothetical protein
MLFIFLFVSGESATGEAVAPFMARRRAINHSVAAHYLVRFVSTPPRQGGEIDSSRAVRRHFPLRFLRRAPRSVGRGTPKGIGQRRGCRDRVLRRPHPAPGSHPLRGFLLRLPRSRERSGGVVGFSGTAHHPVRPASIRRGEFVRYPSATFLTRGENSPHRRRHSS